MTLFYLAIALIFFAVLILFQAGRTQKSAGLPGGRVIYTDTHNWGSKIQKPLYDSTLGLTGKPDYLVEQKGKYIPVEVKSGLAPESPFDAHIYQLASYCLLVEKTTGVRPPYGILHYENRDFAIDFTQELETALLETLADMRRDEHLGKIKRSHETSSRCTKCGFRHVCEQKLVVSAFTN